MTASEFLRAVTYPLTESAVLVPLLFFCLMFALVSWGGWLGLYLLVVLIPAVGRYQVILLEARARGARPETPDIEFFRWIGNAWTLFPVFIVIILAWSTYLVYERFGTAWAMLPVLFSSVFLPVSIAVLAITRSPLQSLNPIALYRLLEKCGDSFWIASAFLFVAALLSMQAESLPGLLPIFLQLYLSFAFFSLVGSLIHTRGLIEDIDLPPPPEESEADRLDGLDRSRTHELNHAYGFISRDNRAGGFKHLFACIAEDADPAAAWAWYFDRMLRWEAPEHALFFAQHYVRDLLEHGERIVAVKVMLRCRLVDEGWKPFGEDLPAAIDAAESSGNSELAAVLKRG